jgi:hypothetical protein
MSLLGGDVSMGIQIAFFFQDEDEEIAVWPSCHVVPRLAEKVVLPGMEELFVQSVTWTGSAHAEIILGEG